MNLKQLEYFVQVAELGSFSKAAVVPTSRSRRSAGKCAASKPNCISSCSCATAGASTLTDAGKRLFDHSVAVLQLMAHAREDLERAATSRSGG